MMTMPNTFAARRRDRTYSICGDKDFAPVKQSRQLRRIGGTREQFLDRSAIQALHFAFQLAHFACVIKRDARVLCQAQDGEFQLLRFFAYQLHHLADVVVPCQP